MAPIMTKPKENICSICHKIIQNKQILKCCTCKQLLDIACANVSGKRYNLMTKGNKSDFKCNKCIRNSSTYAPGTSITRLNQPESAEAQISKNYHENITKRRPSERKRNLSVSNLSLSETEENIMSSTIRDDSMRRSLPNLSLLENSRYEELRTQIEQLTSELSSANNEIDTLIMENLKLKASLEEFLKKHNIYKKILCEDTPRKNTPVKTKKQRNGDKKTKHDSYIEKQKLNTDRISDVLQVNKTDSKRSGYIEQSRNHNINEVAARQVLIVADEQGRNLAITLKALLGKSYIVQSLCKPGAKMHDILKPLQKHTQTFTKRDYVIIIGGSNDNNPYLLLSGLNHNLHLLKHTNTIICQTTHSRYLNETKLNYEIKLMTRGFSGSVYLDMDYDTYIPRYKYFLINLGRRLLKEILRISYDMDFQEYTKTKLYVNKMKTFCDNMTQTDDDIGSYTNAGELQFSAEKSDKDEELFR